MITGIQITKAANDDLLNSFWLLDSEKKRSALCSSESRFCGRRNRSGEQTGRN